MKPVVLEKLEWPLLLATLAGNGRTTEGREQALQLKPQLSASQVQERWSLIEPLRQLLHQGYMPPVDELVDLHGIFAALILVSY